MNSTQTTPRNLHIQDFLPAAHVALSDTELVSWRTSLQQARNEAGEAIVEIVMVASARAIRFAHPEVSRITFEVGTEGDGFFQQDFTITLRDGTAITDSENAQANQEFYEAVYETFMEHCCDEAFAVWANRRRSDRSMETVYINIDTSGFQYDA